MNEEGAPPLVAYPMPPPYALGSAAREGKGLAFLPQGAIDVRPLIPCLIASFAREPRPMCSITGSYGIPVM